MATVSLTHELSEVDAAVDSIVSMQQRFGITAIVPLSREQYDALTPKIATTLYIVYSAAKFSLYYGALPLSGAGGASAGNFSTPLIGGAGAAGRMTAPESL